MKTPIEIANYFIEKSFSEGTDLTPMKLVKLVYITHGWYLGATGEPLISEGVQAWTYGPVIRSIYNQFKKYGGSQITELITSYPEIPRITEPWLIKFLDRIWEIYGHFSGVILSSLTHAEGTPWFIVWEQNNHKLGNTPIIPNNLIASHYKEKYNARTTSTAGRTSH